MPAKQEKRISDLVIFGEPSPLKADLNRGIASLTTAPASHFRPHICLNDEDGVAIIERIMQDPDADTAWGITTKVIHGGGEDWWLNVSFYACIESYASNHTAWLTPRQTSYIVQNLPPESRDLVLAAVKTWYFDHFAKKVEKGFATIAQQFNEGDPLLESDHRNRIFDIHGERSMDVMYTEWEIVGDKLFLAFYFPATIYQTSGFQPGRDGYENIDAIFRERNARRKIACGEVYKSMTGRDLPPSAR